MQIGAAFATTLFDEVGPSGTVFLRIALAALVLLAIWRPPLHIDGAARRDVLLLGFVLAGMNYSFYEALDRIPLGIAVTFEFVGPLGVAVWGSRRGRDLIWVGLAAAGLLLLSPGPNSDLDPLGSGLALLAGGFWAAYIMLTARVGRALPGGRGLALAMSVAAIVTLPVGIVGGGANLIGAEVLGLGLLIAIASSAIPYTLEMEALRRLPQGTFGVLMSVEPAVAALVGFVGLNQDLALREVVAIGLVLTASLGALRAAVQLAPEA